MGLRNKQNLENFRAMKCSLRTLSIIPNNANTFLCNSVFLYWNRFISQKLLSQFELYLFTKNTGLPNTTCYLTYSEVSRRYFNAVITLIHPNAEIICVSKGAASLLFTLH